MPKHWYIIDTALFNLTYEWEVKPIDVVITEVKAVPNTPKMVRLSVLERVDKVYRNDVIEGIHTMFKNETFIKLLNSYCVERAGSDRGFLHVEQLERLPELLLGLPVRPHHHRGCLGLLLQARKKAVRQEGGC